MFSRTGGMWTELAQPIREQNGQVEQPGLRGHFAPGGPVVSVCGEMYGQTQKREFESPKIVIHSKGKDRFSAEKRSFFWSCWADSNRRPHPYQLIGRVRFAAFRAFCALFYPDRRALRHSFVHWFRCLISPCGSRCGSGLKFLKVCATINNNK